MPGVEEAATWLRESSGIDVWDVAGVMPGMAHEFEGDKLQRALMYRVHSFMNARWRRWATPL
eukprot:10647132-Karenia_brevis.AAC.1